MSGVPRAGGQGVCRPADLRPRAFIERAHDYLERPCPVWVFASPADFNAHLGSAGAGEHSAPGRWVVPHRRIADRAAMNLKLPVAPAIKWCTPLRLPWDHHARCDSNDYWCTRV